MQLAQNFSAVHRADGIAVGLVIQTVQKPDPQLAKQDLMTGIQHLSDSKELSRVLRLAGQSAIEPWSTHRHRHPARQAQAGAQTAGFGRDGYFFVYDMAGNNLMHARQPELVGQNLREATRIPFGGSILRAAGGDDKAVAPCVTSGETLLGRASARLRRADHVLGLMVGTGLYLMTSNKTLERLTPARKPIPGHTANVYVIAAAAMILIVFAGLAVMSVTARRPASSSDIPAQRVVNSQGEERVRQCAGPVSTASSRCWCRPVFSSKQPEVAAQHQLRKAAGRHHSNRVSADETPRRHGFDRLSQALDRSAPDLA
jgi:two-component system NarL family sensor kinase